MPRPIGSDIIKRCVLVEGNVSLWEVGSEVLYAQAMPSVAHSLLLLPVDQDVEL